MLSLILLTAAASQPDLLEASAPWWERISVTVDDKGQQQSCTYQSSLAAGGPERCDPEMASSLGIKREEKPSGAYSKFTFERRFSPAASLDAGRLQPGDKLLARQVLFLTIGADGTTQSCRVVSTSGDMRLAYGCDEARTEQFKVPASAPGMSPRQAFLTILAYGHEGQIV